MHANPADATACCLNLWGNNTDFLADHSIHKGRFTCIWRAYQRHKTRPAILVLHLFIWVVLVCH